MPACPPDRPERTVPAGDRTRVHDALRIRAQQQAAVAHLGLRALDGTDLDALLQEATDVVAGVLGWEFSKVLELLPAGDVLRLRAGVGWKSGLVGSATVPAHADSQAGYTLDSREPVVVADLTSETRFAGPALLRDHGVVSGMSVIIGPREKPFGVLAAHSNQHRTISEDDVHFLQAIANVLACAIVRHGAETALRGSERLFRALIEHSSDGIALLNRDGIITFGTPSGERMTGFAVGENHGKHFWQFIHPEDLDVVRARFSALLRGESVTDPVTFRFRHKDGSWRWLEAIGTNLLAEPAVRAIVVNYREVTERKQAEEALRVSEERHRIFAGLTSDYVYVFRIEPDGRLVTEWMSEAFFRITGYSRDDFATLPSPFDLAHPDDLPAVSEAFQRSLAGHTTVIDLRVVTKSGATRWLRAYGQPIWDADHRRVVALYGATQDITERKLAEAELHASRERLAVLSRQLITAQETERRNLARELHDEIGQVLTAVLYNLHVVKSECAGNAVSRLDESIAVVNRAIEQVRDLSLDLRPTVLDEAGLRDALRWLADRLAEKAGLIVDVRAAELDLPQDLKTACFRVAQEAFTNVVRHARAKHAWLEIAPCGDYFEMLIRDDGVGFDLAQAWERVRRGESLGLAGMRERIELLGGQFAVESAPGQGTTVRIQVPWGGLPGAKETEPGESAAVD